MKEQDAAHSFLRNQIAEIIKNGVTYNHQTGTVIIHGAIDDIVKLIELHENVNDDIDFVKTILPPTYTVQESKRKGSIHCFSKTGIVHKIDADDDEHWEYIVMAIKQHFGKRFLEIDHNTNFCHVDFTIHLD